LAYRASALEMLQPEYSSEVLAQKARDLVRQLGFEMARADEAFGLDWDEAAMEYLPKNEKPFPGWREFLGRKPGLLRFGSRQSTSPMIGVEFHDDMLTPGVVVKEDPPFEEPGMIAVALDQQGRLLDFERIPDQRLQPASGAAPTPDWRP